MKWALAVLAAFVVCLSWAQSPKFGRASGESPAKKGEAKRYTNRSEYPTKKSPLPVTIIQSANDARSAANREKAAENFNDQYLHSQIGILESSQSQANSARAATVFVFVETVIAAAALYFLRKTYKETERTAEAANQQVALAIETRKIDRAWMMAQHVVHRLAAPIKVRGTPHKAGFIINVVWSNTGRTPATGFESFVDYRVVEVGDDPNGVAPPHFKKTWSERASPGVIGPNSNVHAGPVILVEKEYDDVMAGRAAIFIYSAIRYFDIFDRNTTRTSEVTFEGFVGGMRRYKQTGMLDLISRPRLGGRRTRPPDKATAAIAA